VLNAGAAVLVVALLLATALPAARARRAVTMRS
jgi:hypothetical protein